jgi:peptidyl-prolyl cis-trans isomerase A (cyclophilin A)
MKRRSAILAVLLFPFLACCQETKEQPVKPATPDTATTETKPAAAKKVRFKTNKGDIVVELNAEKAPVTVANFLGYVNKKHFDGTVFHRVIADFMIQGGGFAIEGGSLVEKATGKGIVNEGQNGLRNDRGTIAMARTADPNSATAQFFINVKDNPALNYPSNGGYAVFGKVISGMEVVDVIKGVATGQKELAMRHPGTGERIVQPAGDVPVENVVILSAAAE